MLRNIHTFSLVSMVLIFGAQAAWADECPRKFFGTKDLQDLLTDSRNITFTLDRARYGEVITNNSGADQENLAEFTFELPGGCAYKLEVEYAAAESRPVDITFNDRLVTENGLPGVTGGWGPSDQKWQHQCDITSVEGDNKLRFHRTSVFPHIRAVKLTPR